jgi:hypothetical protein
MRVLITGSTTWTNREAIRSALAQLPAASTVVTGDTDGVDAIAIEIASELGLRVKAMRKTTSDHERYPDAPWKGLNERMMAAGIDLVLAFHPDIDKPGKARGTKHVIELAEAYGIPIKTCH